MSTGEKVKEGDETAKNLQISFAVYHKCREMVSNVPFARGPGTLTYGTGRSLKSCNGSFNSC